MKKIFKKLLTVMFVMTMFFSLSSHTVLAEGNDEGQEFGSASLTITNLNPGDQFRVWKIVKITHNSTNNTLVYDFTPASGAYFNTKEITIGQFMTMSEDETLIKSIAGLSSDIFKNTSGLWVKPWTSTEDISGGTQKEDVAPGLIEVNEGSKSVTINGLTAGGYYIEPYKSNVVYQPMFVPIVPKANANQSGYECENVSFQAKWTEMSAQKFVKRHGAENYGDFANVSLTGIDANENYSVIDFKTIVSIPHYVYGSYNVLTINEKLPQGVSYVNGSLKILSSTESSTAGSEIAELVVADALNVNTDNGVTTLTIDLKEQYAKIQNKGYVQIIYQASVNDNVIAKIEEGNKDCKEAETEFVYSAYPYLNQVANVTKSTDTVKLYTNGIKINKVDELHNDTKLQSAKFELYRADDAGDTTLNLDGSSIKATRIALDKTIVTDSNGSYVLNGVSSDAKYYLVEISAPAGYQLDSKPKLVNSGDPNADGYYELTIVNKSQTLSLPTTGATGMVAFTVCGLAVMAAAIVILVKTRESH